MNDSSTLRHVERHTDVYTNHIHTQTSRTKRRNRHTYKQTGIEIDKQNTGRQTHHLYSICLTKTLLIFYQRRTVKYQSIL